MTTSHFNIILSTNFLSSSFFPRYLSNSLFVLNFLLHSIFTNLKAKSWYYTTIMYIFLSQLQTFVVVFCHPFVFYCRAPVSILFQFHPHRCPYIPSSLSERNNRAELIKHHRKIQKFYAVGGGFRVLGLSLCLFC